MGETREVGKPAQREQTREQPVPKNELRRMGENLEPKEILPLKLSSEHTYEFGSKSVQAFRSSSKSFRLSLSFGVQKIVAFIGS